MRKKSDLFNNAVLYSQATTTRKSFVKVSNKKRFVIWKTSQKPFLGLLICYIAVLGSFQLMKRTKSGKIVQKWLELDFFILQRMKCTIVYRNSALNQKNIFQNPILVNFERPIFEFWWISVSWNCWKVHFELLWGAKNQNWS